MMKQMVVALLVLLLTACGREGQTAVVTPTSAPSATSQSTGAMSSPLELNTPAVQATLTATAVPTFTPSPTPTPIAPVIVVQEQTLTEAGQIAIASVQTPQDGWVAIHAQSAEGSVGAVLAQLPVRQGQNSALTLTIDPYAATPTLWVLLYPQMARFVPIDPALPWQQQGVLTAVSFPVQVQFTLPALNITNQAVAEDGLVRAHSVYLTTPGWLALHANENGTPGALLGHVYLEAGLHEDVPVPIPWREAPLELLAMLYEDGARPQRLDLPGDVPVRVNGEILRRPFRISLPPDVLVYEQPIVNSQVVIERVVSDGPGWLAVHNENDGAMGLLIGRAPLVDGVNEGVVVTLSETPPTDRLFIMLHRDEEPIGQFNFPRADPRLEVNGRVMDPIPFRVAPGNTLFTQDQPLQVDENGRFSRITIPLVIADLDIWLVIRRDAEGQPGDIIAYTWLPAGVSRNVALSIDPELATETLYAVLHQDVNANRRFEYPQGGDVPLQRNRRIIQAPFTILNLQLVNQPIN